MCSAAPLARHIAKYGAKAVLSITSHISPTLQQDRFDFALRHPPLDSRDTGRLAPLQNRKLTITGAITRHNGSGPHVVTCQLDDEEKRSYVAKIFDAMDYPLPDEEDMVYEGGCVADFMSQADEDYATEARAYEIMRKYAANIEDLKIPEHYGSWTITLPMEQNRCVRFIFLEEIKGVSLSYIIQKSMKDKTPLATGLEIIDFNRVDIWLEDDFLLGIREEEYNWPHSRPISPIESSWVRPSPGNCSRLLAFSKRPPTNWLGKWVDMDGCERDLIFPEKVNEWLVTTFKESPKFCPLSPEFMNRPCHKKESVKLQRLIGYKKPDPEAN
ncbi:hypothetical protein QBC35DRAFT_545305 [Podospora australis]|uniref:Uncharacterized protein n=1 Tax=Podospora australis TaxID=1536484 RepID=A0AAN7ADW3_9PEZI|nr:hypothetical protein QBC35DRAFT_545305 [Podospora australis]